MGEHGSDDTLPKHLTETYHKARRSLVFFSGLLIVWEYLGLGLAKSVKTPVGLLTPTNPEAVPVVLLLLVLFFGMRLAIEWSQCDPARREFAASRVDLATSYTLGVAALFLFIVQQALKIQMADVLTPAAAGTLVAGFLAVILARLSMLGSKFPEELPPAFKAILSCIAGVMVGGALVWSQFPDPLNTKLHIFLIGYLGGLGLATLILLCFEAYQHGGFGELWQGSSSRPA